MASRRITTLIVCLLAGLSGLSLLAASAMAEDPMEWQFSEFDDPDNEGRKIASLIYGVPETDNIQVSGVCNAAARPGAPFPELTFGADIGDLENGKDVELRFSGGGFDHVMKGKVQRATGEGISGVVVAVEANDPLWTAMAEKASLDYLVPGYKAATLDFARGKSNIQEFVQACRNYANAGLSAEPVPSRSSTGSAEKDAFESAKDSADRGLASVSDELSVRLPRRPCPRYVKKLEAPDVAPPPAAFAPARRRLPPPRQRRRRRKPPKTAAKDRSSSKAGASPRARPRASAARAIARKEANACRAPTRRRSPR